MVSSLVETGSSASVLGSRRGFRFQKLLTQRGILALVFLAYLFLGPVAETSDIIASVLSFSFLGLLVLISTITLFRGRSLRSSVALTLRSGGMGEQGDVIGGEQARLILGLSPIRIQPFFLLRIQIEFKNEGVVFPYLVLTGVSSDSRHVGEEVRFPHRGEWTIESIQLTFGDQLGLCAYSWNAFIPHGEATIRVGIPKRNAEGLPVISSSTRPGDLLSHTEEKLGDPFDLKQYHPSDGIKKIVWKVFARSGELVARHPESSMTPEGQVVVFGLLSVQDDLVAGDLLSYIQKLERLDLSVYIGCRGMNTTGAKNSQDAEKLLIESVWRSSDRSIESELSDLLQEFENRTPGSKVTSLVVFCSEAYVGYPEGRATMDGLDRFLTARSITPVFFVHRAVSRFREGVGQRKSRLKELSRSLLWHSDGNHELYSDDGSGREFFTRCGRRGWEVLKY